MTHRRYDLAFPTHQGTNPEDWTNLSCLYLPGVAHHVEGGDRVWLRHRDRLFYSYEISGQIYQDVRWSDIDDTDRGPGPTLQLRSGSGRPEDRRLSSIRDPDGVRDSWGRGLRYLSPGARRFVRIGSRRGRVGRLPRLIPLDHGSTEPTPVVTSRQARQAERAEAKLTVAYVKWMHGDGRFHTLAIPTGPRADIRADMYSSELNVLIEVKSSPSRNHLRLAVGQLLDYVRMSAVVAVERPDLAVLVPSMPDRDLMDYLGSVSVAAIWRARNAFVDSAGGRLTTPWPPRWRL